jgi:uncharacterized protein YlbG (UPF0298 family)
MKTEKKFDSSKDVVTTKQLHSRDARMIQNFHLVWIDDHIYEINNKVNTFIDVNECIDFITDIKEEKIFLISSGSLGQTIIPLVHGIPQISKIYIFCTHNTRHEQWTREWYKVVLIDVYTDITPICKALKQVNKDYDQNLVPISFVEMTNEVSNQSFDTLDSSFMYTQIVKEILLIIDFEQDDVDLTLTSDNDQQLHTLIELMFEETKESTEWFQLGKVMIKGDEYEKTQQLYEILLNQTHDDHEKADIYYHLGWTMDEQGEYADAIRFYEKSLEIRQLVFSSKDARFATIYNNMDNTYMTTRERVKALEIFEETSPSNHPNLATSYNNIGTVYNTMCEYSKALAIRQQTLPANHIDLDISYGNMT